MGGARSGRGWRGRARCKATTRTGGGWRWCWWGCPRGGRPSPRRSSPGEWPRTLVIINDGYRQSY
eukprot:7361262-Pyramimonas_sp.AAC.1